MFPLPPNAGRLGQRLFHDGGGVDKYFHVTARLNDDPPRQRFEGAFDDIVIVSALRISRNAPPHRFARPCKRIDGGGIAHAQRNHALHLGPQPARGSALPLTRRHPDHVAMPPRRQPITQPFARLWRRIGRRNSAGMKADMSGVLL